MNNARLLPSDVPIGALLSPGIDGHKYTATWDDTGVAIYTNRPKGNLYGELPIGSKPVFFSDDPEDPWLEAQFSLPSGRTLTVRRVK